MAGHSHDNMDWNARLEMLRDSDALTAPEMAELARRLLRPGDRSIVEVGSGAGGQAAAFAAQLPAGGSVQVVDVAQELLDATAQEVRAAAPEGVEVRSVLGDAAEDAFTEQVQPADLVFAAAVVHHLPDQLAGLRRLAGLVRPGGRLAIVEFGLEERTLPWDIGLGEPGLEARLSAARNQWFRGMREGMDEQTRLPMGWGSALREAGLTDVETWSYLVDRPAPVTGAAHRAVLRRLEMLIEHGGEQLDEADLRTVQRLLDPEDPEYAGNRSDLYYLSASTVHVGTRN
ncbi:methyltransferase domain-containing protein [Saccharopolyspora sp. HNM0983]|uniref:Methyltransferase domain-containing protein n=1 Tax=Saccharopolyspora montiporae TaxID=2781240 RepID=A0A929BEP1_9PSEU|nr:methyltransferase [Saccharopolyspora sp. HNM0983]MBE9376633.1 methyltransferase domain-containing protein [Saccharopolyspora sp. HNM0983]